MKMTLERCTIPTIRHLKDTQSQSTISPPIPGWSDMYAYAAFSSAHLAGHLRTGMGHANKVMAYPVGMFMTENTGGLRHELK